MLRRLEKVGLEGWEGKEEGRLGVLEAGYVFSCFEQVRILHRHSLLSTMEQNYRVNHGTESCRLVKEKCESMCDSTRDERSVDYMKLMYTDAWVEQKRKGSASKTCF